jgi:hypothetical protein
VRRGAAVPRCGGARGETGGDRAGSGDRRPRRPCKRCVRGQWALFFWDPPCWTRGAQQMPFTSAGCRPAPARAVRSRGAAPERRARAGARRARGGTASACLGLGVGLRGSRPCQAGGAREGMWHGGTPRAGQNARSRRRGRRPGSDQRLARAPASRGAPLRGGGQPLGLGARRRRWCGRGGGALAQGTGGARIQGRGGGCGARAGAGRAPPHRSRVRQRQPPSQRRGGRGRVLSPSRGWVPWVAPLWAGAAQGGSRAVWGGNLRQGNGVLRCHRGRGAGVFKYRGVLRVWDGSTLGKRAAGARPRARGGASAGTDALRRGACGGGRRARPGGAPPVRPRVAPQGGRGGAGEGGGPPGTGTPPASGLQEVPRRDRAAQRGPCGRPGAPARRARATNARPARARVRAARRSPAAGGRGGRFRVPMYQVGAC